MNRTRKKEYIAPLVERINARVERGFATSRFNETNPDQINDYNNGGNKTYLFS